MNAYDLLRKYILETENAFKQAKADQNIWRAEGIRKLYFALKELSSKF